jgi:DNA-binding response OmpR family regulator
MVMSRILVAEDEPHILLLIQRKLETAGHTVATATNGDDALEMALRDRPDLLLLDILMPGREGLDVCKEVKTAYGDSAPPVIIISALGQQLDVEAGISAGADDYIIKPFSPRALLERVEAALYR